MSRQERIADALRLLADALADEAPASEAADPDVLLDRQGVAALLSMSPSQAGWLLAHGELPGVIALPSSGKGERQQLRIRRSALLAWISKREGTA